MVKISVIIPVYNAAEFLSEALDSVLNQTLEDIEVIAVNDGSKDNSLDILRNYAEKDSRLIIIDQENSGPSAARNNALSNAQGEYVFFFDADDMLNIEAFEKLYKKASETDADLVIGKYDIFNGVIYSPVNNLNSLVKKDRIDKYDKDILWTFSLWNKLFRRSVIEENHFVFEPISYSEDGVFTMNFVYHARVITGCAVIVNHYRRMTTALHTSITATVNENKIRDYLTAHRLIYLSMKAAMMEDNQIYDDFPTLLQNEDAMNQYINEFFKKEINILLNQFYKKFWSMEENLIELLGLSITRLLNRVNLDVYYQLASNHPELNLDRLYMDYSQAIQDCRIEVALYGSCDREDAFIKSLRSLCAQTLIQIRISVPACMRICIQKEDLLRANVCFLDCDSKEELYQTVLERAKGQYILLADDAFSYESGALRRMYLDIRNMRLDVYDNLVNINIDDKAVPCSWHGKAIISMKDRRIFTELSKRDALLPNKLISVEFLRSLHPDFNENSAILAENILKHAYFAVTQKVNVIFEDGKDDVAFIDYLKYHAPDYFDHVEMEKSVTSLFDTCVENNMSEIYKKLMPSNIKKNNNKRKLINMISKLPVQNKVLFYSIRKNGQLEGNLKAIFDYVEGRKSVCAHLLPHNEAWKLKMYYEFATSKVIVVDDYARYLRLFPMKPEQRVVQLWHACGAFKKFGIHGTNLSMHVEKSTHMQYNLVSVSSENIRQIYASAFDIDVDKVSALGVPRTDIYFNNALIEAKRTEIYKKYPQFIGRQIILYAPTFRDKNAKREIFKPKIDFADLSRRLCKDTLFIIAPHPIMTEPIVTDSYDNIMEIRDISTGDLMFVSDLMVTDYSSVIFEYALLGKPIVFYCYDKETYNRGFYLDYDHDLPGEIFEDYESFVDYLCHSERQIITEKHQKFVEKYMGACDGHCSERIAKIINEYMGGTSNG